MLFCMLVGCRGASADGVFNVCTTDDDCHKGLICSEETGCTVECSTDKDCNRLGWASSFYCNSELGICCGGHHGDLCELATRSDASQSGGS
jgi:hypothetical protein